MPEAFVLFKTQPTRERDVYLSLSSNDAVSEVHVLYGEFDLLVRVSSDNSGDLSKMLVQDFRQIDGVRETQTMIAVDY
jgi:DNA-binding Lrp family transcriptional regulator